MDGQTFHTSVLKKEAIEYLQVAPKRKYIDGTLGAGGHSIEIVRAGGEVLGIDQDRQALAFARRRFLKELPAAFTNNSVLVYENFRNIERLSRLHGFSHAAGILLDLGMSSYHINASKRGFSYRKDELLDMRMDSTAQLSAADVINRASAQKLYEIFTNFGEQQRAEELINRIERTRAITPIRTSFELVQIMEDVYGAERINAEQDHLARVFQSLRIAVNEELSALREGLYGAAMVLKPGGRLVVISFHSLEDRIVKLFFRQHVGFKLITKKAIRPSDEEVYTNSRSRSARMRVVEKL